MDTSRSSLFTTVSFTAALISGFNFGAAMPGQFSKGGYFFRSEAFFSSSRPSLNMPTHVASISLWMESPRGWFGVVGLPRSTSMSSLSGSGAARGSVSASFGSAKLPKIYVILLVSWQIEV